MLHVDPDPLEHPTDEENHADHSEKERDAVHRCEYHAREQLRR